VLVGFNGVPATSGAGASAQEMQGLAKRVAASFLWVGDPKNPKTWG
jgi:hypothetical protein